MANDLTTYDDGFEPIAPSGDRVIVGTLLRFVDGRWSEMGLPVPDNLRLLALSVDVCLQHWQDQKVIATIIDKPLPDPANLNAEIPKSEWEADLNGNPRPPWVTTHCVYLLNATTGEKYTYANSTIGARIARETLQDKVAWVRRLRGENVVPEVSLASLPMNTRFGQKQRPHFKIESWVSLGGGGLDKPTVAQIKGPTRVEPVSTAEMLNDDLPF
jgi:hypothetical protein